MAVLRDERGELSGAFRVLVIGDGNAAAVLESTGHAAVAASTVDAAIETLADERFDCLLIETPRLGSVDRLERLCEATPSLPVVALCETDADARAAADAGARVVRTDPESLSGTELVDELASAIDRPNGRDAGARNEAIADLGRRALEGASFDALLERAVATVADALGAERCGAFELVSTQEGRQLCLREGVGWGTDEESLAVDPDGDSGIGHALLADEPVVADPAVRPERAESLADDVGNAIGVPIGPSEEPWGALGTYGNDRQAFTDADVGFVRGVADVLTGAVDRDRRTERFGDDLEEVYGRVTDAFFGLDDEWRFTFLNERAEELINPEGRDLVGETVWEAYPEAEGTKFETEYRRAMDEQAVVTFEEYYPEPLDAWYEVSAYPSETGLSVYFRDVTERKEREQDMELFRSLLDRATDAIYVNDPETGEFLDVNETATRHLGYAREELLGMTVPDVDRSVPDRRAWRSLVEEIRAEGQLTADSVHRRKDGSTFPAEVNASHIELENGREYVVAVGRDVTERKEMEERLRERERRFRSLAENLQEIVWMSDAEDLEIRYINPVYESVWGRSRASLYEEPLSFLEGVHPEDRERVRESYARLPDEPYDEEFRVRRPDGEIRWVHARGIPVEGEDGEVDRIVGIAEDVTERRNHERELREERDLIERIVETSPVGIITLDADGGFELVNDRAEEILGHSSEELEAFAGSTDVLDPVGPDGESIALEAIPTHRVLAEGETFHDLEMGLRPPGGERVWLSISATPLVEGDEVTGGVITFADVTDRRTYENELERYRRYTDDVLNAVDDVFYVLDESGALQRWNESVSSVTGYTDEEIGSMNAPEFFAEDDREAVAEAIATGFETGHTRVEAPFLTREGESIPYEFVASTLEDPDGRRVLAGIGRDVTEREEATAELRRRIDQQAAVARLGQLALETDDPDELFEEACELVADVLDNEYCKVLDLDAEDRELLLRRGVGWRDGIVGSATVGADESSQAGYTLLSKEPVIVDDLEAETRFSGPELLTSHDVVSGISVVIGSVDRPWGILGTHDVERREFTVHDANFVQNVANVLTSAIDRVEYERELERYETIVETVNDGIYTVDEEGRFTTVNETYASMLGYDPDELVGAPVSTVVDDEVLESVRELQASMIAGEAEAPTVEAPVRTADGGRIETEATLAVLSNADGSHERVGVVRDVTERNRLERQLRLSAETLHELYELTASSELSFERKLERVLEVGCERLDLPYGILTYIENGTMTIVESHGDHELLQPGESCPLRRSYCRRVLGEEGLVAVDDALEEGWADDPAYETFELGTYVGGQVTVDDELYGTICFASNEPRGEPLSDVERTFVELVNGWVSYELERTENQRELERQRAQLESLDQLNHVIRDITHAILETPSREEIETTVCERLAERYRFAWIGGIERGDDAVTPRTGAGVERDYLDELDISIDAADPNGRGPTAQAVRDREPQFRTNVLEDPDYEPWHEAALERNYRSSTAIPIQHEDSLYGVLNVYSACPDAFDEAEREILTYLGEVVGHTVYAVEQRRALTSDTVTELEFRLTDADHPLVEAAAGEDVEITSERLIATSDGSAIQFATVTGMPADEFVEAIERYDSIERARPLNHDADEESLFEMRISSTPLPDALAGFGGRLTTMTVTDDELRVIAELPPDADVRAVVAAVESVAAGAELLAQRTVERDETSRQELHDVFADRLTEKQRIALETAYFAGYFDWPRGHTGEEVAELLDLSPATLAQHLRIAERKLFGALLDDRVARA